MCLCLYLYYLYMCFLSAIKKKKKKKKKISERLYHNTLPIIHQCNIELCNNRLMKSINHVS